MREGSQIPTVYGRDSKQGLAISISANAICAKAASEKVISPSLLTELGRERRMQERIAVSPRLSISPYGGLEEGRPSSSPPHFCLGGKADVIHLSITLSLGIMRAMANATIISPIATPVWTITWSVSSAKKRALQVVYAQIRRIAYRDRSLSCVGLAYRGNDFVIIIS